jgi:hypothetical protein
MLRPARPGRAARAGRGRRCDGRLVDAASSAGGAAPAPGCRAANCLAAAQARARRAREFWICTTRGEAGGPLALAGATRPGRPAGHLQPHAWAGPQGIWTPRLHAAPGEPSGGLPGGDSSVAAPPGRVRCPGPGPGEGPGQAALPTTTRARGARGRGRGRALCPPPPGHLASLAFRRSVGVWGSGQVWWCAMQASSWWPSPTVRRACLLQSGRTMPQAGRC